MHLQLVTYSVHIPPLADPFCTLYTFCYLSLWSYLPMLIYFLKLSPLYLRQSARTSVDLFGTRTSGDLICVGIIFNGLFCTQFPPHFDLYFIRTTSSRPSLYTIDLYGLFCIFISWWSYLYIFYGLVHLRLVTYSVHIPPLVELFCT